MNGHILICFITFKRYLVDSIQWRHADLLIQYRDVTPPCWFNTVASRRGEVVVDSIQWRHAAGRLLYSGVTPWRGCYTVASRRGEVVIQWRHAAGRLLYSGVTPRGGCYFMRENLPPRDLVTTTTSTWLIMWSESNISTSINLWNISTSFQPIRSLDFIERYDNRYYGSSSNLDCRILWINSFTNLTSSLRLEMMSPFRVSPFPVAIPS